MKFERAVQSKKCIFPERKKLTFFNPDLTLMKAILLPLFFVTVQFIGVQGQSVDSLMAVLDTARLERKVKTLNELFRAYQQSDPVKAIGYTREALNLASEIDDRRGMAAAYNNLGVAYRNQGALDKALQYYMKALRIFEQLNNKEGIASTKSNIATIYSIKKDYALALKYFNEAHSLFIELNDKQKIIASLNNLGNINSDMQLQEKALKYYSEAWQLSLEAGKPFADPLVNMGNVYFRQGNYQRAIEFYLKALELERNQNNRLGMLGIITNIGIAFTRAGQPAAAQTYLNEAESMCHELNAYATYPDILRSKAINLYRLNNVKDAFTVLLKYDSVREQIYGEESSRNIARMELALELSEKEKEYEMLKKQAEINALELRTTRLFIVLAILALLLVVGAVNFYFMGKRKTILKI
jgi:tetratricopeptide (TPR) repeat protein